MLHLFARSELNASARVDVTCSTIYITYAITMVIFELANLAVHVCDDDDDDYRAQQQRGAAHRWRTLPGRKIGRRSGGRDSGSDLLGPRIPGPDTEVIITTSITQR